MALRALPDGFVDFSRGSVRLLARAELAEPLVAAGALAGAPPARWGERVATLAGGRRPFEVVRVAGVETPLLVKQVRRGGWLAPLLRGLSSTDRAFAEILRVESLRQAGVPAVPIVAARVRRAGRIGPDSIARVELALPFVAGARDLLAFLEGDPPPADRRRVLASAGRALAALHRAGVAHPDLNLRNLLVAPGGDVLLIVLGGRIARADAGGVAANFARLWRSATKWGLAGRRVSRADALRLLRAHSGDAARRLFGEARARFERDIARHRLAWRVAGRRVRRA